MINILNIAEDLKEYLLNNADVRVEDDRHFFKIKIRNYFGIDVYIMPDDDISEDVSVVKKSFYDGFNAYVLKQKGKYEDNPQDNSRLFYLKDINSIDSFKIEFKIEVDEDDETYIDSLFSGDYIDYGNRIRLTSMLDSSQPDPKKFKTPVITFYSYKGGMGRTTTMVSYAIDLALRDKKVFIIDCDLEAPGYINFFNLSKHADLKEGKINGFAEYLCDKEFFKTNVEFPLQNYYLNITDWDYDKDEKLRNIYLMPAGNLNSEINRQHYLEALARINIANPFSINKHFEELITQIENVIEPDVILLDSRTGFNDIIGTAISYLSDMIVGFFGNNAQSKPGLDNLLDEYAKGNFKLTLVNSILSENTDERFSDFKQEVYDHLKEKRDDIDYFPLYRHSILETIGIENNDDEKYISLLKNKELEDFVSIFKNIDTILSTDIMEEQRQDGIKDEQTEQTIVNTINASAESGQKDDIEVIDDKSDYKKVIGNIDLSMLNSYKNNDNQADNKLKHAKTVDLRKHLLDNLLVTLKNVKAFAETTDMNRNIFFYRDCMNELFDDYKFLIRGYKGTGKTYLYRALATNDAIITKNIRTRANNQRTKEHRGKVTDNKLKFIDIISLEKGDKDKSFDFTGLAFNASPIKDDPEYFFTRFWQIHIWNSILLDKEFESIKNASVLKDYIQPIGGATSIKNYQYLIEKGIDVFIEIEKDMNAINNQLANSEEPTTLFILIDQLDSKIKPQYWSIAVSPLINYWRENYNTYSNILPKIFIRTDLMKRIKGTNTARLSENVINIEWSIEEILGYFIKLAINSNKQSFDIFFEILSRIKAGKYEYIINRYKYNPKSKFSDETNQNQIYPLLPNELRPFVYAFFGREVKSSKGGLGQPDEYFKRNYANADQTSISMRPFINIFSSKTIEKAKKDNPKYGYVTAIIPSEAYASKEIRDFAVDEYFKDLSQNEFSGDLMIFKNFLTSAEGKEFSYKTLTLNDFDKMMKIIVEKNTDNFETVKDANDLKSLLEANGIIAEYTWPSIGKIYRFAPLYYYSWHLKSTKFDKPIAEDAVYGGF